MLGREGLSCEGRLTERLRTMSSVALWGCWFTSLDLRPREDVGRRSRADGNGGTASTGAIPWKERIERKVRVGAAEDSSVEA